MDTTLRPARAPRTPLSPLGRLTAATLLITAAIFGAIHYVVLRGEGPPLLPPILVLLIGAAVVATGWRWAPLAGAALLGLLTVGLIVPSIEIITQELLTPGMPLGPLLLIVLPTMLVGLLAGLAATVQNLRRSPAGSQDEAQPLRAAPRWLAPALIALAGLALGAAGLHAVAVPATGAAVNEELLASLPTLAAREFAFEQQELRVRAGELVAMSLTNADVAAHSFDVDELDVHVLMPAGEQALALFRPSEPGVYTFYCAPHYDKATGQGMRGTLIVE